MDTQTNGHGHDFSNWSLRRLNNRLEKLKRPGRPSPEVKALREAIAMQEPGDVDAPKRGRGAIEVDDQTTSTTKMKKGRGGKAGKPAEVKISIPPIETGVITVTVKGMDSLIMHRWDEKSKRQIQDKQGQKSHKPRVARDPKAEYNAARYIDHKKRDCVPALSFKNAIVAAASFLPDVTKTLLKGAIFVKGGMIPIKFPGKSPVFREDMVRIGGMSKTADVRDRPEYPDWSVDLEIEFDKSVLSPEQVVNLVNRAGFNVGVGEWRPTFGRFRVVRT